MNESNSTKRGKELLAQALSIDEKMKISGGSDVEKCRKLCIEAYIAAAELLLKDSSQRNLVSQVLDRIEVLKSMERSEKPSTFTSLEAIGELPAVPSESHMKPSSTLTSTSNNTKTASAWVTAKKSSNVLDIEPNTGELSEREIFVLKSSSVMNGKIFMPWLPGEETRERFRFDHQYVDPDGLLPLSPSQIAAGVEWRRPSEVIVSEKPVMIQSIDPLSIQQHFVSDCSFVCSLCIASAYEAKFKKRLITSIIFPQNSSNMPVYNAYGKYIVKLLINGVKRKVVVDDRLPYSPNNGRWACSSSINLNELWISIIEKAYMKVNGGYDFPGSNSDVDLFALTGWIPEHLYFQEEGETDEKQDHTQSADRGWQRIKSAHKYGDCLITIGTGRLTAEEERETGLVPTHAYAVLDVREAGILRMLQVKNPWSTRPWIGPFSSADRARWTPALLKHLGVTNKDFDIMEKCGIFWMEFTDCRKYFPGYYLNWNPGLFSFRTVIHDMWPLSIAPKNDSYFTGDNPQFCLIADCLNTSTNQANVQFTQTIWILLSRHLKDRTTSKSKGIVKLSIEIDFDRELNSFYIAASGEEEGGVNFLALHIHCLRVPRRLYGHSTKSIQGVYSDGVHTLVRIDTDTVTPLSDADDVMNGDGPACDALLSSMSRNISPTDKSFTLVLSQRHRSSDVNYTINVYGTVPFRFYPTPIPPPHKVDVQGEWTSLTCGSPIHRTFYCTPQYRLVIPGTTAIHIHLQILYPKDINGKLYVTRGGNRTDGIDSKDEVISSGKYKPGYCCCEGFLDPGNYTVVLSTYEEKVSTKYFFTVRGSSDSFRLAEIEQEGFKGYSIVIVSQWQISNGTAAGCTKYNRYNENPLVVFSLTNVTTRVSARLLCTGGTNFPVNLSIFQLSADPSQIGVNNPRNLLPIGITVKTAFMTSNEGVYSSRGSGAGLTINLPAGTWALIPSTYDPVDSSFEIYLSFSSTQPVPWRII